MSVPLTLSEVPNVTPSIQYVATGGQTVFPYPFPITQDSDLIVVVNGATLNTDSGYTLSGQGNDTGGNVTFTLGQTAGAIITLYRDVAIERISQISQNSGFSSTVFNAEYNNIYLIMQQLETSIAQCLQMPLTNNPAPVTTLTPAIFANKYLSFDSNGNPQAAALVSGTLTALIIGSFLFPAVASEAGITPNVIYPYDDPRRFGILAANSAATNTAAFQALVSKSLATTNWAGRLRFVNTSGSDVIALNDILDFRDNIYVDLQGVTLAFTKGSTSTHDTNAGFVMAQRNFGIENGTITVNYTGGANMGAVLYFGARGSEAGLGAFYPNSYDSILTIPQGNIYAKNLRITSNNPAGELIQLAAGLDTVLLQNIDADGQSVTDGIDYEFGWATSGTTNLRQTSHAKNLIFDNIKITNVTGGTGTGLTITGAYNFEVRNLYVNNAQAVLTVGPGESLYYNPWASTDDVGCKRTKRMVNIVGEAISTSGIILQGSGLGSAGYLSAVVANPPLSATQLIAAQTHLGDFILDGFALTGTSGNNNYGVQTSGHTTYLGHGDIKAFQAGLAGFDDATFVTCDGVKISGCKQEGFNFAAGNSVTLAGTPVYLKKIIVRNCLAIGNSTSNAGAYPGIQLNNTDSAVIDSCRFNSETAYPGEANEATQGSGIQLGSNCFNVKCSNNRMGFMFSGNVGYYNVVTSTPANGNEISGATGVVTSLGVWDGVEQAWVPVLTCATPGNLAVSYTTKVGGYTKRGNRVDYWFDVVTSAFTHTSGESGNVQITGLPYASTTVASKNQMGSLAFGGITKSSYTQVTPNVLSASQLVQFQASGSAQAAASLVIGDLPTGGTVTLQGSGSYFV